MYLKYFTVMLISSSTDRYNRYVEVVGRSIGSGACANMKRNNTLYEITDETKIISLLSTGATEDGYDWLYLVIKDIVRKLRFISNSRACRP